jgi:hypothetical protein
VIRAIRGKGERGVKKEGEKRKTGRGNCEGRGREEGREGEGIMKERGR